MSNTGTNSLTLSYPIANSKSFTLPFPFTLTLPFPFTLPFSFSYPESKSFREC